MERLVFASLVALALAGAVVSGSRVGSASPYPTPTPVALQYEEISRFAFGEATPVPPGYFEPDRANIIASAGTAQPQHHGLLGGMMNSYQSAMTGMQAMQSGTLTRYTYYHGWVRTDDVVHQTAVITKCELHQYITLDLAHHTYTISSTVPAPAPAPGPGMYGHSGNGSPGTVDMSLTGTSTNLGPRTLEQIPTHGGAYAMTMAMTNATGSCSNLSMTIHMTAYISRIGLPRAYCPLPRTTAGGGMPGGPSCSPRIHMSGVSMAPFGESDHLAMYKLVTFSNPQMGGETGGMVTEAGNVRWLYKPEADALFSIPPGFTQT